MLIFEEETDIMYLCSLLQLSLQLSNIFLLLFLLRNISRLVNCFYSILSATIHGNNYLFLCDAIGSQFPL